MYGPWMPAEPEHLDWAVGYFAAAEFYLRELERRLEGGETGDFNMDDMEIPTGTYGVLLKAIRNFDEGRRLALGL
jgi:hypothetical protein